MTIRDNGTQPHRMNGARAGDLESLLRYVRETVKAVLAESPRHPGRVRVRAGEVTVELDWQPPPGDGRPPVATVEAATAGAAAALAVAAAPAEDAEAGHVITAENVGAFYHRPAPDSPPFVAEGDVVVAGQQIGLLEAMKVMIPVLADRPGRIVRVLSPDAGAVQYGDPLFLLAPEVAE